MRSIPILMFIATMLAAAPAHAHLDGGADQTLGTYLVDFGWDPGSPRAGETTTLAFNLIDNEKAEPVDYDNVWVRIASGDAIVFAGVFRPEGKNVTFSLRFPAGGSYEVKARFKGSDGGVLTEATFTLPVEADGTVPVIFGVGLVVCLALGSWFGRRSFQRTSTTR